MPFKDPEKRKEYSRRYNAKYRSLYPERRAAAVARFRKNNAGITAVYCKRSYERHRDARIAAAKAYREANRSKVNAASRKSYRKHEAKCRARVAEWRVQNPDKVRAQWSRHRARRKAAPVDTDRKSYEAFVRRVRTAAVIRCYWCGHVVPKALRRIDHIVPLSRNGIDGVNNLCCSCEACNDKKAGKMPHEFSGQRLMDFSGRRTAHRNPRAAFAGEMNGNSKLTEENVVEILRRLASRESQYAIAERFMVSQGAISAIAIGHSWKNVPRMSR